MSERATFQRKGPVYEEARFIPSGSVLLDLVLGGGWAIGRTINLVGDSSTGKTLLAIEACAMFAKLRGNLNIRYCETEAAFDVPYARTMGFPKGIEPLHLNTIEEVAFDLDKFVSNLRKEEGGLYIIDSFDALTDAAELERDFDKAGYGMEKVKLLGKMFRQQTRALEVVQCTLIIISQTRDAIGVMFGEKKTRSGGKALRFYSSQEIWLAETGKVIQTIRGTKRVIGIDVRARMKKNKVGTNYREANFTLFFNYGIDDEASMITFLDENKTSNFDIKTWKADLKAARASQDRKTLRSMHSQLKERTMEIWEAIEEGFAPPMQKYEVEE
jgi:recombination protein RecA